MKKRTPKLSAGSMADIAFLLLVFFLLVTEIPEDHGLLTHLPEEPACEDCFTHERNMLQVKLGKHGELLVDGEYSSLDQLRTQAERFYRNGGILVERPADPNYPQRKWVGAEGASLDAKQELTVRVLGNYRAMPRVAGIQLDARPFTPYPWYVEVNDALVGARFTVMNEVLKAKGLPVWEVMENDPAYRKEVLAVETAVPDRAMDLLPTE